MTVLEKRWRCPGCLVGIWKADGTPIYAFSGDGPVSLFHLIPGTYQILYKYQAHEMQRVSRQGRVELKAGHRYSVEMKARYGPRSYGTRPWIGNRTSGQVVAGEKW